MSIDSGRAWVIERDPTYQHFALSYLANRGYKTRSFSSYEECLQYFTEKPDLVILDHNLESRLKGIVVLEKLKTEFPDTPIISLSSQQQLSLLAETYRSGASHYIEKNSAGLIKLKISLDTIKSKRKTNPTSVARKIKGILLFAALCLFLFIFFHLIKN